MFAGSSSLRAAVCALALVGAAGCDVGVFSGPGESGDDDDDDGDDGDGGGNPANRPDAFPAENIICLTEFIVSGTITHDVLPAGGSCDAAGTWSLTVSSPTADDDHPGCDQAPGDEDFTIQLSRTEGEIIYDAVDLEDESRVWTVQVSDKGGSCSASFRHDLGGGAQWDLISTEQSPGGPIDGTAQYEMREIE